MTEWTRPRINSRARTFRLTLKTAVITCALLLIVVIPLLYFNAKTIEVQIDGKTVEVTTFADTVGGALEHSRLGIYPEDRVVPSRDTAISPDMKVQVTRSKAVQISVDGQTLLARSAEPTVGEAISDLSERYELHIKDSDEVNVARSEPLVDNMELTIARAIPIRVIADGEEREVEMAPRTVAEALAKLEISLGPKDKVSLPLDQVIQPNDEIQVVRVLERVETVTTAIPYQTVAKPGEFPVGLPDRVITPGENGVQEQTVRLTLEDGKEVDREILSQRVVTAPTTQVVSRGNQTTVSRGGQDFHFKRAYLMRATAYSIPGGTTATGDEAKWGVVAVDPNVIPLGSEVYVEGYGEATALDTGSAIKGNRIDLFMNSKEAAISWGVRYVVVYVQ